MLQDTGVRRGRLTEETTSRREGMEAIAQAEEPKGAQ